ncbi:hypothetical protein BHE74_00031732 [Ensete ventricosum]|uniref:Uncharacterized protein n=1 Tax=Ensete ventricosum TaxID=4639 RepID=A0A444CWV4_ENSVE|nr:hypothetical protein GW17_00047426 [Ensete ventricosum]RWW61223.1 hypothetical protein BHE74_00031732 [Ensete ventricosum]RZR74422.1 hypothetical protein BHM03_00036765 [Ensete ventricosum]
MDRTPRQRQYVTSRRLLWNPISPRRRGDAVVRERGIREAKRSGSRVRDPSRKPRKNQTRREEPSISSASLFFWISRKNPIEEEQEPEDATNSLASLPAIPKPCPWTRPSLPSSALALILLPLVLF